MKMGTPLHVPCEIIEQSSRKLKTHLYIEGRSSECWVNEKSRNSSLERNGPSLMIKLLISNA